MLGMDPMEFTATIMVLIAGIGPLLQSWLELLLKDIHDFGAVSAVALRLGLFEAKNLVHEVREHFIKGDGGLDQAIAFKDSYTPTFSMVGVAGAIIAQIALTALTLPNMDDTHWTARASFVVGLVAGSLAVSCSCILQSKMSALHTAQAVRGWLTRPREETGMRSKFSTSGLKELICNPNAKALAAMKEGLSQLNKMFNENAYRPSLSAALIITAPLQLLNIALGSLLTGFGIYFGFVYSANLSTIGDHDSALAVLVVYIASAASGLLLFYMPVLVKLVATMSDQKGGVDLAGYLTTLEIAIQAAQRAEAASKHDAVSTALNQIIAIQEKQLQLQKDFQTLLEARFHPPSPHPPSPHPPSSHPPSPHLPSL
jgi:uncharacterized membrane protein YedE/YeeE